MQLRTLKAWAAAFVAGLLLLTTPASARNPRGYGIGTITPPPSHSGVVKFFGGYDYAFSYTTSQTTLAQAESDINTIATQTVPHMGYAFSNMWTGLETAGTNLNNPSNITAQYGGFATNIEAICNYAWEKLGAVPIIIYITGNRYGQAITGTELTTTNWSQAGFSYGFYIPSDLVNAGGSGNSTITEPNTYGSSSSTTYPIAPIYSGSAYHGLWFWTSSSSTYGTVSPNWTNQGVVSRFAQLFEALAQFSWTMPTTGSTPSTVNGQAFAGQTFTVNNNPLIAAVAINDEYSYDLVSGTYPSGGNIPGQSNNPPTAVGTADQATYQNMFTYHEYLINRIRAAFPNTPFIDNFSFGFDGLNLDSNAIIAGQINNYISGSGLTGIPGYSLSSADTTGLDFNATDNEANAAKQGFIGITNPGANGTSLPTPTATSAAGKAGAVAQVQPFDYCFYVSGAGSNESAVEQLMASPARMQPYAQTWSLTDYPEASNCTSGHGVNVWASGTNSGYIASALIAYRSTYPLSQLLPVNFMVAPANFACATSGTNVILTYSVAPYAGTSVTYTITRDGSIVAAGQTSGSYTDSGAIAGSHTYSVYMTNTNGSGSSSTASCSVP